MSCDVELIIEQGELVIQEVTISPVMTIVELDPATGMQTVMEVPTFEIQETPVIFEIQETNFIPIFPVGTDKPHHDVTFTLDCPVPSGCDRAALFLGDVSTACTPWASTLDGFMKEASFRLDAPDPTGEWAIEFWRNGALAETVPVAPGALKGSLLTLLSSVAVEDDVQAYFVRVSGTGRSPFRRATVHLGLQET